MSSDSSLGDEILPSIPGDDPVGRVEHLTTDADAMEDYIWSRDYIDVMNDFDVSYTPEEFQNSLTSSKPSTLLNRK